MSDEELDVQLLAWAVVNCHMLARRALARSVSAYDREKWEHVLRICEKAGARSHGVLRASVPTEITDGGAKAESQHERDRPMGGMMKVYLCGGINGLSDSECRDWREVAKELLNADTLDPMRRDYRGKEDESVNEIVRGDLDDIRDSFWVLVNATRPSWGTAMEIVYAYEMRKPILAFVGDARVSPWLRYHCGAIFKTVEEVVAHINAGTFA